LTGVNHRLVCVTANEECLSVAYGHLLCVTFLTIDQVFEMLAKVCRRVGEATCLATILFGRGIFHRHPLLVSCFIAASKRFLVGSFRMERR
jgi:hypothetical protein